ncbi:hypothetical protein LEP1GSC106_3428, partial [Leptospira interrogans serovar Grippotyphosa str. UI 12764]
MSFCSLKIKTRTSKGFWNALLNLYKFLFLRMLES